MKRKIEIGTRLWVLESDGTHNYAIEIIVYTLIGIDQIFAVDSKGKTYHFYYENGEFTHMNGYMVSVNEPICENIHWSYLG